MARTGRDLWYDHDMGLLGQLIGEALGGLAEFTREAIAGRLRDMADRVERGDLVPDEALEQAKKDQARIDAIRAKLRG